MKYRLNNDKILISLSRGDRINEVLEIFAENKSIGCAWVNGIGAIENPEVGFYSLKDKIYNKKIFFGEFELISLVGNITIKDDKPFSHTHITFSNTKFEVLGGHLFDAKVSVAGEFVLIPFDRPLNRKMNIDMGLPLWCLEKTIE